MIDEVFTILYNNLLKLFVSTLIFYSLQARKDILRILSRFILVNNKVFSKKKNFFLIYIELKIEFWLFYIL